MDWLEHRQDAIEAELARRHLGPAANLSKMALFDLSSSWLEGRCCPLAARGYSRDGKKGKLQIEYGLLTDPAGLPVAVRVFPGNTGDPAAFTAITDVVRTKFELAQMVMVGDRGMITSARIAALNQTEDGTQQPDPYGWITALRAPAIRKLMADDGPLQLSLFDQQDLAEITSPDFPGERLIACRNPVLAADRARTRNELLAATEKLLAPLTARVQARPGSPEPGRLRLPTVSAAIVRRFRINGGHPWPGAERALEVIRRASPHKSRCPVRISRLVAVRTTQVIVTHASNWRSFRPGDYTSLPILGRGGLRCSGVRDCHSGGAERPCTTQMLAKSYYVRYGYFQPTFWVRSARLGTPSFSDAIPLLAVFSERLPRHRRSLGRPG